MKVQQKPCIKYEEMQLDSMIDEFALPDEDHDDIDIYDALGLNTPVSNDQASVENAYDPLAAFMDDDEDDMELGTACLRCGPHGVHGNR